MQNFRNDILKAVQAGLYNLEIHDTTAQLDIYGRYPPIRPNQYAAHLQPMKVRTPNSDMQNVPYETPTWQTLLRPVRPQDVKQQELIPSVFLQVLSGERSARGRRLQNSPQTGVVGDISEDYTISIQCVLCDGWGAPKNGKPDEAKEISEQVNGFVSDMDRCLNVYTLRPMMPQEVAIPDAYIAEWHVRPAMEGSPQTIVMADLVVSINYNRNP